MQYVLPAARGLRNLYSLGADQLWFALAVVGGLLLAAELADLILLMNAPRMEQLLY